MDLFEPQVESELKHKFFNAIEWGNIDLVKSYLEEEPELLNIRAANDWTPVMFAVRYGWLEMTKYLIDQGWDLDNDKGNYEILHTAWIGQNEQVIRYLLKEKGWDLNCQKKQSAPYLLIPEMKTFLALFLTHGKLVYEIRLTKNTYKRLNRSYLTDYDEIEVEGEDNIDTDFIDIWINDPFDQYDKEKVLKAYKIAEIDKKIVYDRHLSFLSVMLEWERQGSCPNKKNLNRILAYI